MRGGRKRSTALVTMPPFVPVQGIATEGIMRLPMSSATLPWKLASALTRRRAGLDGLPQRASHEGRT